MPDLRAIARLVTGVDTPLPGPLNNLPTPARVAVSTLLPPLRVQGLAGQLLDADQRASRALTGAGVVGAALANRAHLVGTTRQNQAILASMLDAYQQAQGNPFQKSEAVNEAFAGRVGGVPAGVLNALTDPANLLGPAGKGAEAAKFGRVADLLTAVDRAQNAPVEALAGLARQGGQAAKLRLLREVTGNVADEALPVVGGKRQLGPIRPPEQFGYAKGNAKGKAGPVLPPELGPPAPEVPPATQPVADLLNAARKSAQPNPLEQLIGAGRGTAARDVAPIQPRRTIAQIEAAFPKRAEANPGQVALPQESGVVPAARPLGEIGAQLPNAAPEPAGLDFTDRAGTIRAVANAPIEHLNLVLRDLHNAVYPGQQADFAIPALTGKGRQEFRTSFLTDHPSGNAAEPYLDYLISRVQKDKKAAARLAEINPLLADDVGLVAENPLPLTEHKRLVQSLFDVGPQGGEAGNAARAAQETAPASFTGTVDDVRNLLTGEAGRVGTMYPPSDPAFYAKRANVDPAQVPAMLDQLVREGTLGRLPDGSLGIKPAPSAPLSNVDTPPSITDPAERAAWQARYVGQSQAGTDILAAGDKVAGGDLTQADLNALSPRERMAALRKLAGGDIAAGGGGFGLLPTRGGLGAANRAVAGAATGALAGGAAGAALDEDDRLGGAAKGAAAGALLGGNLGAGAGLLESRLAQGATNSAGHPLLAHGWEQAGVEQAAANAASGNLWSAIRNLYPVWRRNVTEHPRNLLGDEGWGRTVLQGAQGAGSQQLLRQVRDEAAGRLDAATPWERLPQTTQAAMAALGREGQVPDLGSSFHTAESNLTRKVISTSDQMIGSGILSLGNPAAVAQNLAGAGGSVALGAVRPGWHGFFQAVNGFQQETFRQAAFADEAATGLRLAAERFLPDLEAAGVDISRLAPDGSFGVADVHAVAGQAAADRWRAYGDAIYDSATRRVKFLFGDFSKRSGIEKALGGPIPFTSWMIRAYPVALSLLAQHPAVALAAYQYMRLTSQGAGQDGRPGYTAGMIPVDDKTPILGALVNLYTQGEGGKGYLDPVGGISPVGGEMFQPAEDDSQKNWYQRGTALLSRLGLPGVNPAIQAGAYVTGLDYKAPGALSRTQGLENAAALLPGNPQLPDVAGGLLRAARGSVSQATAAAGLPGAQADKTPTAYDPITRRYAELVFAATGKPLSDQANQAYLLAMGDPENALMQQARREVLLGGAAKNVGSLTSPVGVIGQSGENAQYRAAKVGEPFSAARIAGSSPGVRQLMQAGNTQYRQATPASQIYTVGNREQGAYSLLDQFDADPQVQWMRLYTPKSYKMQRDELMIRLGLKEPPKPARTNPYLTPSR